MARKINVSLLFLTLVFFVQTAAAEQISFNADYMTGRTNASTDTTRLVGNAFVRTSSMEINADEITIEGSDFTSITATGSVRGKNLETKLEFTCEKLRFDRITKIARLENFVHLTDVENNVTADAHIIDYNQNNDVAIMQIEVSLVQKDNLCTAAYAVYKKRSQTLEMSGNPKITQGKDSFRAQEISLNLETQEIILDGRVNGTVSDSKEKNKKPDNNDDKNAIKQEPKGEADGN